MSTRRLRLRQTTVFDTITNHKDVENESCYYYRAASRRKPAHSMHRTKEIVVRTEEIIVQGLKQSIFEI